MDLDSCYSNTYTPASQENLWLFFNHLPSPRVYKKNEMIYRQDDCADYFYYVKKGQVKIFLSSESGAEKTLAILEPGSFLGEAAFFDSLPRVSSAKALVKSEIAVVGRAELMDYFRQQPALAMNMLQVLSHRVRLLSSQVDHMTFLQADQRIAQLLIKLSAVTDKGKRVVSCTQDELASLAGTHRVTVCKILHQFAEDGWIDTQYRNIVINDWLALCQFAGI